MSKRIVCSVLALGCLVAVPAAIAQSSITCGPLDNGRIADVFYKSNAVFFDPVVEYQYEQAVLTISGPCENITKTFKPGEDIFFDLAEVERVLDGQYQWELRFMPAVDPGVREELQASRGSGEEDDLWWSFWQKGLIPAGPSVDSASFTVSRGAIIDPGSGEEEGGKSATLASRSGASGAASLATAAAGFEAASSPSSGTSETSGDGGPVLATKDFVINDDLIVIGSTCIGFDCVNGEVFGFDTLRFRENNLRIKFDDTSGGSFPTRNWEIEINSSANGGQTHFRVNDVDAGRAPFTIEGTSPSHSLYVESSGDVGLGTSNPVVDLHVTSGDTPTLRLDQNTSQGFASQVWDVAGNETSFFVRDATSGSTLPFRIRPGASSNSLVIDNSNDVGIGTLSPNASLDIERSSEPTMRLTDTGGESWDVKVTTGGNLSYASNGTSTNFLLNNNGRLTVNSDTAGGLTFDLSQTGDLTIAGDIFTSSCSPCTSDYVFEPGYELMPLNELAVFIDENGHLPNVPSEADYQEQGRIGLHSHQLRLLEKVEELVLYTLSQQEEIEALRAKVAELEEK